jgi:glycosyltransferase involved in cell wall biosynthesis
MIPEGLIVGNTLERCGGRRQNESPGKRMITAIIPTYRRPHLVGRAIRSVLRQTYPHFQVCVYDNASCDETASVVREFHKKDSRVEYVCRATNIGACANFADAANRVETPFFSFLPDDDVLLPDFFSVVLDGFRRCPEAGYSAAATIRMWENGTISEVPLLRWREGFYPPPQAIFPILEIGNPDLPGLMFRRDVWKLVGGFDNRTDPAWDLDIELKIAARFPVVVSSQVGAILIGHPDSLSTRGGLGYIWPGGLQILQNLLSEKCLPSEAKTRAERVLRRRLARYLFVNGGLKSIYLGKQDDAERAAAILGRSFGLYGRAAALRVLSGLSRRSNLFGRSLMVPYKIRSILRKLRNRDLQQNFGGYAVLLQT